MPLAVIHSGIWPLTNFHPFQKNNFLSACPLYEKFFSYSSTEVDADLLGPSFERFEHTRSVFDRGHDGIAIQMDALQHWQLCDRPDVADCHQGIVSHIQTFQTVQSRQTCNKMTVFFIYLSWRNAGTL